MNTTSFTTEVVSSSSTMYDEYLETITLEANCRQEDPDGRRRLLLGNILPTVEDAVTLEEVKQITVRNGYSNIRTLSLLLPRLGSTDMTGQPRVNHRKVTINSVALCFPEVEDKENILKRFLHDDLHFKDAHICITPYCFSMNS